MRKLIAMLMTLALLAVPALSLAQDATVELVTFEQADGLYTFQYPSNWTVLDRATIDAAVELAKASSDEKLSQTLETYKSTIKQVDMTMMLSEDMLCNVIVSSSPLGMSLSAEQLLSIAPTLLAQYDASFSKFEATNEGSLEDIAGNSYMLMEYNAESVGQSLQGAVYYIVPDDNLYTIVLTAPGGAIDQYKPDFETMLTTLIFAK